MSKKITLKQNAIKVIDDLVSPELVEKIWGDLMSPVYCCNGLSNQDDRFPFWVVRLDQQDIDEVESFGTLWGIIDKYITQGKYVPYHTLVNANNFGDCPMVHTDLPPEHSKDCYTIIYYAHKEWHHDWAGETVLLNEQKDDIIQSVYPRPGRIFAFDSAIPHVARTPTRITTNVRFTIAFRVKPKQ